MEEKMTDPIAYCSKCGNALMEGDMFCAKCGNQAEVITPPVVDNISNNDIQVTLLNPSHPGEKKLPEKNKIVVYCLAVVCGLIAIVGIFSGVIDLYDATRSTAFTPPAQTTTLTAEELQLAAVDVIKSGRLQAYPDVTIGNLLATGGFHDWTCISIVDNDFLVIAERDSELKIEFFGNLDTEEFYITALQVGNNEVTGEVLEKTLGQILKAYYEVYRTS